MKNTILILLSILTLSCSNPKKNLEFAICKDSIQYWNYEWPHRRSEFFGFTFSFNKNGKALKYSYDKKSNTRALFTDYHYSGIERWKVTKDSILTLFGSDMKITSYSENEIYCVDKITEENVKFIKVKKSNLNIVE